MNNEWHGDEIMRKARTAEGRAIVAIGVNVDALATQNAHALTGTLRRSIHVATPGNSAAGEYESAQAGIPVADTMSASEHRNGQAVEVGSWIPYAAKEEVEREHYFMQPAVESVRTLSGAIVKLAFKSEGL